MAKMKYAKLLLKWVRSAYKKQDAGPSEPDHTSNKHQMADSSADRHPEAIPLDTDTGAYLTPALPRLITSGCPDPAVVAFLADMADNIPLLDRDSGGSDISGLRIIHRNDHLRRQHRRQALPSQPAPPPPAFHVIIVGGGPTGLVLAHALHQATVPYTLLEQQSHHVPGTTDNNSTADLASQPHDNESSLLLWPDAARILDQLGLLRRTQNLACPMRTRVTTTTRSSDKEDNDNAFARALPDHGRPCMLVARAAFVHMLWSSLPERNTRVQTGKEVVSVEAHDDGAGVRVTCKDGSVHEGSVVVGCDGVHSVVRRGMCKLRAEGRREAARRRSLGLLRRGGEAEDRTMEARYYGLVGSAPRPDGLEAGVCYEARGGGVGSVVQVFAGEDEVHFLAYVPLHRPTTRQTTYPPENAAYLAAALANIPITTNIRFSDLWLSRRSGKMVDFHEGIAEKWYHSHIALAGSAAHSTIPILGLGAGVGIQGVAELANGLRRLLPLSHLQPQRRRLSGDDDDPAPDTASVKRTFKTYQAAREDHARTAALTSAFYARAVTNQSALSRACGWAAPGAIAGEIGMLDRQVGWAVRQGITLDFVEEEEGHFREGRLGWVHRRRRAGVSGPVGERVGGSVWLYPGVPFWVRGG